MIFTVQKQQQEKKKVKEESEKIGLKLSIQNS